MTDWLSEFMENTERFAGRSCSCSRDCDRERDAAYKRINDLADALREATELARHLFGMIDRQAWRDTGGDDGQGHYEGDYRAEGVRDKIDALAARAALDRQTKETP